MQGHLDQKPHGCSVFKDQSSSSSSRDSSSGSDSSDSSGDSSDSDAHDIGTTFSTEWKNKRNDARRLVAEVNRERVFDCIEDPGAHFSMNVLKSV